MTKLTSGPFEVASKNYKEARVAPATAQDQGALYNLTGGGYGIILVEVTAAQITAGTNNRIAVMECDYVIADKDNAAINVGAKVYYTIATKKVSATGGVGTVEVGVCTEAAAAADTTVKLYFDGFNKVAS